MQEGFRIGPGDKEPIPAPNEAGSSRRASRQPTAVYQRMRSLPTCCGPRDEAQRIAHPRADGFRSASLNKCSTISQNGILMFGQQTLFFQMELHRGYDGFLLPEALQHPVPQTAEDDPHQRSGSSDQRQQSRVGRMGSELS